MIRKRAFGSERYPGYEHAKTGSTAAYSKGGVEREFVFEKVEATTAGAPASLERAKALRDPTQKAYEIKTDKEDPTSAGLDEYYFECSTDDDSSDYYESDNDQ